MIKRLPKSFQVFAANKEEAEYLIEMQEKLGTPESEGAVKGYYQFNVKSQGIATTWSCDSKSTVEVVEYTEFKEHFSNVDNFQWLVGQILPLCADQIELRVVASKDEEGNDKVSPSALRNGELQIKNIATYKNEVYIDGDKFDYPGPNYWRIPIRELYRTGLIYQLELPEEKLLKISDLRPGKDAIECNTREEYTQICELMHQAGYKGEGNPDMRDWTKVLYDSKYNNCIGVWNDGSPWATKVERAKDNNYTIYQASQFINNMEKEIIGYRLKEEYKHLDVAAGKIAFGEDTKNLISGNGKYHFAINSSAKDKLKAAGVLELWFEPVYAPEKPKEVVVSMNGQFDLVVKDKKVYHKNEDITTYVKELVTFYMNLMEKKIASYAAFVNVNSIQFQKTGCEMKTTTLADWKKVYDMIKD